MTDEVTERVRRLVAERRKMRGIGEEIVGVHFGTDREAWLTNDDLLALCIRIAELEGALRPFAEASGRIRPNDPDNDRPAYATVADYRHACATLNGEKVDG